jgi:hypothetical protein
MIALLSVAFAIAATTVAPDGRAQCGANRSTCSGCHDGSRAPFAARAAWHADHAFADVCAVCHGGVPDATEARAAHAGLVAPLAGETQCGSCHGEASATLARRYVVEDAGAATHAAIGNDMSDGASGGASGTSGTSGVSGGANNGVAAVLAVLIGVLGLGWVVAARDRDALRRMLDSVRNRVRDPEWSPYVGGVVLGLVVAVSMGIFGHRLSGAGAYQHLSGFVGKALAPRSMYWMHVVPTGFTWDVQVVVGAIAGAFVSSRLAGTFRWRTMPDSGWREVFGTSVALRWAIAFFGSMLTEIGGGLAGGCTASLAVSGGAVLAPAAFIFMMGMFAGGIPTLAVVTRLGSRHGGGRV